VPIDADALPNDPIVLQEMLRELYAENDKLRLLIQRLTRHQFGRRSEQLTAEQLQFGLEDQEQTVAEHQAAQDAAEPAVEAQSRSRADRRPARNHGALPLHLPRYEVVIDAAHEACPCCGSAMHCIGELRTDQLDIAPAQLRVRVTRRPRYACRSCEEAIVTAEAPARPIDGGMPTEALIVHVVVSKFCDGLPLYRQSQMLARQGVTLDRSTLSNWVGRACWWLAPLYELIVDTVLTSNKLFADDTTLPVLDPGRGRTKTGRLWCYAVDARPWRGASHPAAAYVYSEDHRVARPAEHLATFQGVLQVDGYNGFKRLAGDRADASVRLAFFWAHMRRGFYDFHVSTKSPLAAEVLARIRTLYAIEAEIRGHPAEHQRRVRQERSRPIVEALHTWLEDHLPRVSGASDLAQAMRYALRHWSGLLVFLEDGRVEMDTNVVERAIRPIPMTREAALFAGR
jgi:transposase